VGISGLEYRTVRKFVFDETEKKKEELGGCEVPP
jgi:hypothetical protein